MKICRYILTAVLATAFAGAAFAQQSDRKDVRRGNRQFEDGEERMVTTPWFDHEISMTEAAEKGTYKVISEHSTIGIVITTDGSICDIPREKYIVPEQRVINELKEIGKPFVVLLNCADPESEFALETAREISEGYGVRCLRVNCLRLEEEDISDIMRSVLEEFPLKSVGIYLPEWLEALPGDNQLRSEIFADIMESCSEICKIKDCNLKNNVLKYVL